MNNSNSIFQIKIKDRLLLPAIIILLVFPLKAKEIITISPKGGDMTSVVRETLEGLKTKEIKLIFEKGTYSFFPKLAREKYSSITNHGNGLKRIAFLFEGFNSIEIDGNGAEFIFHGQMAPFQFINCERITVRNLTIDWDIPFGFQGDVLKVNKKEKWFEIRPYIQGFSWELKKGQILFPNIENFNFSSLGSTLTFDKDTKRVAYGAKDINLRPEKVEKRSDNVLRIYDSNISQFPKVGTVIHSKGNKELNRYAPAFHVKSSKNIHFDRITIHHALGMGFLFERTDNIKILNSGIYVRKGSDRVISIIADATHFANCKGEILIENCHFENMLDDGTNVHGTYVEVNEIIDNRTIRVALKHFEQTGFKFAEKGDKVWFIIAPNPGRGEANTVSKVEYINEVYTVLSLQNDIPKDLKIGDVLENKTWNPKFTLRGSTIRHHRARNMMIKTPRRILIEDNDLSSMMSSIMLRGESFFWYESGAVKNVIIRNNRFTNAVYGGAPEHAIVKISPRLGEAFDQTAIYDSNIVFENNTIETFGNRIVWADRIDGLVIKGNRIVQTKTETPQFPEAPMFELINSKDVKIIKNSYKGTMTNFIKADETSNKTLTVRGNTFK